MTLTTLSTTVEDDIDPIADFISALVVSGTYRPEAYGIPDEAFTRWRKVHEFCREFYLVSGTTVSADQLTMRFPNFPFVTDIPASWASHELHAEYLATRLNKVAAEMTRNLIRGDTALAYQTLIDGAKAIQPTSAAPVNILSDEVLEMKMGAPVPIAPGSLAELTGGIVPGELWFIGARPGRGKTWDLIRHATAACSAGFDVVYFSMEMNYKVISDRYLALAYGWEPVNRWNKLDLIDERKEARDTLQASRGDFLAVDPSIKRCDTMAVAAAAAENTLIIVDHVGLMKTSGGNRSIEDHRIAAAISNELKEISLQYTVPIIAAIQLNRRSEGKTSPSLSDLAQTDAAGQDADLVYAITAAEGSAVQQCTVVKNRRGPTGTRWFNHFLPGLPSTTEISKMKASGLLEAEFANSSAL
jgi:hypothetical protein